jgi:diacylglycerol O-acyltransferase / wax synthase
VSEPPDQLSPDDAAILALESAAIAGHTLKVAVLEPGEAVDLEKLRASVTERLATEPRGRQRVELGDDGAARWVEDADFEIDHHVRRRPGTEGVGEAEMWRAAGEIMSERLDHRRPLWSIDLVGPLADGREAVVARVHHAMADGISAVRFLGGVLWSADPRESSLPPAPSHPAASQGDAAMSRAAELRRLPGALARELGHRAGESPLDRPIGAERELAFIAVPLAELKAIGHSRPGHVTVNDVLLAVVAGGLRRWLEADHLPELKAQIPVSLHHRNEAEADLGNRDSYLNIDLPLSEADPLARLDRINAETVARKELGDAQELYDFFHALARFKHLGGRLQRFATSPREFSLSISNVPGPREAIAIAGRRVERLGSAAEPADRHALRVSAISCAGSVGIGLCTDPGALPGLHGLARALEDSYEELRTAAVGVMG